MQLINSYTILTLVVVVGGYIGVDMIGDMFLGVADGLGKTISSIEITPSF